MTSFDDDLLKSWGATTLGSNPAPSAVKTVLGRFGTWAKNGASAIDIELARAAIVNVLSDAGCRSPARLTDAALADAADSTPTPPKAPPLDELMDTGRVVLSAPDQLQLLRNEVERLGYAGDTSAVELVHLAFASRCLRRPINCQLEGPSAAGKTYTVEMAMKFHPPEVIHDLTAMSERALAYSDFDFSHRFVVIGEASALFQEGIGATIIRSLAWGQGIKYELVEKTRDGLRSRVIEKSGPTGLITTTTRELNPEISTRLLRIHLSDSPTQTRAVVKALASRAAGKSSPAGGLESWHAAAWWIELYGDKTVAIPFADELGDLVPVDDVRMRRDFEQIMTVVAAHALLHQRNRERDAQGRIVADERDYRAAYRLLASVLAITLDSVTDELREAVEAVAATGGGVSYPQLAERLKLSRSGAWRRARAALKAGYLANAEERRGYPAKLVIGDPLPQVRPVLPAPEDLFADAPLKSTQPVNTPQEKLDPTRERGVEQGVEPPEVLNQQPDPINTSVNTPNPHDDGEKSGGVEPLRGNQGDTGKGVASRCPSCMGGKRTDQRLCSTCEAWGR